MNNTKIASVLASALLAGISAFGAAPAETRDAADVIARARAAVGTEDALAALKTLSFDGELFDADGKKSAEVSLRFKRPYFMRETLRRTETEPVDDFFYPEELAERPAPKTYEVEVTTLCDGVEGVRIVRNLTTRERRVFALTAEEVLSNRDLVRANFDFYAALEGDAGTTTPAGTLEENGKTLALIEYVHANGLKILRAFDAETGALVFTEMKGARIYDEGEKTTSGGLTFLDESRTVDADGNVLNVLKFTRISVNEDLPDSLFRATLFDLYSKD